MKTLRSRLLVSLIAVVGLSLAVPTHADVGAAGRDAHDHADKSHDHADKSHDHADKSKDHADKSKDKTKESAANTDKSKDKTKENAASVDKIKEATRDAAVNSGASLGVADRVAKEMDKGMREAKEKAREVGLNTERATDPKPKEKGTTRNSPPSLGITKDFALQSNPPTNTTTVNNVTSVKPPAAPAPNTAVTRPTALTLPNNSAALPTENPPEPQTLDELRQNWNNAVQEALENGFTPSDNPKLKADSQGKLHYESAPDKTDSTDHDAADKEPAGETDSDRDYDYKDTGDVSPL
jgi:hypothetical protein